MSAVHVLQLAVLAGALALLALGASMAFTSANVLKRLVGVAIAHVGALTGALGLEAPATLALGCVAALFATLTLGAAIVVRLQEDYGAVEGPEIDAADQYDEPPDEPL